MLVSPNDCGIDHCVFVVRIGCQSLKQSLPNAALGPPAKPRMDVLPRTKSFRQIPPGDTRAVTIEHRFNEQAIVVGCHPNMTLTTRQKILDPIPLVVPKCVPLHLSAPNQLTAYESRNAPPGNPLIEDRL
jgi:hypothetical protein